LTLVQKLALLSGAILTEVAATLSLRAFQDNPIWLGVVVPGYVISFFLITLVLRIGMPIGVVYGIWAAAGTALTAMLASLIFDDPFTLPVMIGIGLIIIGVLLVEFGSYRAESAKAQVLP
jgi:small multidrug resistance pump